MTGAAKLKGDAAEREAAGILADLTGHPVRRMLGAGRSDDVGDLEGLPGVTVQVASWADTARAAREKPLAAEQQRLNAGNPYAVTMVRFRGGTWRMVLTVDQWVTLWKAAAVKVSGLRLVDAAGNLPSWPDLTELRRRVADVTAVIAGDGDGCTEMAALYAAARDLCEQHPDRKACKACGGGGWITPDTPGEPVSMRCPWCADLADIERSEWWNR